MVQVPGAEDDAALLAAVGIDGVEGRAHVLIERALKVGAETAANQALFLNECFIKYPWPVLQSSLPYLAGKPSFLCTQAMIFIAGAVKVAAVVFCFLQHLHQSLRSLQELCLDFGLLYAFRGFQQLSVKRSGCEKNGRGGLELKLMDQFTSLVYPRTLLSQLTLM